MLVSKRGVYLPELVLVPKRQPGVQMNLNSNALPDEIETIVKEDTVEENNVLRKNCKYPSKLCSRNA